VPLAVSIVGLPLIRVPKVPVGDVELRQLALRLAMLMIRRLFERLAYARLEEVAIWARLNLLPPQSDLGDQLRVGVPGRGLSERVKNRNCAFPF
jgi:hypothetical protein